MEFDKAVHLDYSSIFWSDFTSHNKLNTELDKQIKTNVKLYSTIFSSERLSNIFSSEAGF